MDEMMKINLRIDGELYPLTIRRSDELLYRLAAKEVNDRLNKYRQEYPGLKYEKYLTMVALEMAFKNISMKDRNDTAPYQEKLAELTKEIEKYFSDKEE